VPMTVSPRTSSDRAPRGRGDITSDRQGEADILREMIDSFSPRSPELWPPDAVMDYGDGSCGHEGGDHAERHHRQ
jgi:hypothetical protein